MRFPRALILVPFVFLGLLPALADEPAAPTRTLTLAAPPSGERLDPPITNGSTEKPSWSVGFVAIPGGTFTMGALPGEGDPRAIPAHEETVAAFWLADVETPQGLFARFCAPSESAFWPEAGWTCPASVSAKTKDLPVADVTWWEAIAFANWLTAKEASPGEQVYVVQGTGDARTVTFHPERKGYRLPTSAEWEWAARAGDTANLYIGGYGHPSWGCDATNIPDCVRGTADVFDTAAPARPSASGKGAFKANAWGLYHMGGNVQEWVWDPATSGDGTPGKLRVFRGGSWDLGKVVVNVNTPDKVTLDATHITYSNKDLPSRRRRDQGFRLAKSL